MISVPTILISLFSALAASFMTSFFNRQLSAENFNRDVKRQIYGSFIDSFFKSNSVPEWVNENEEHEIHREFVEQLTKLSIFGSDKVLSIIPSIAHPVKLTDNNVQLIIVDLVLKMRRDAGELEYGTTKCNIRKAIFARVVDK
jgi:hypothetical protein